MRKVIGLFFAISFTSLSCTPIKLVDGVMYENILENNPELSIHIVKINPAKVSIILEIAHGKCNAAEKVTSMAQKNNAIVAINGGFFDYGQKNKAFDLFVKFLDALFGYNKSNAFPVFCLKTNNCWYSLSNKDAGIIGWKDNGKSAYLDTTQIVWQLKLKETLYPISDINKPYAPGPIVYTPAYDTTTPIKNKITEFVVVDGILKKINKGGGTPIPDNGFIYAVEKKDLSKITLSDFDIGESTSILKQYSNETHDWTTMDYLLGSTPLLIKNGKITETILHSTGQFFTKYHPRTAIGILGNGNWVFVVVDGRQKHSQGMTLLELAKFMKKVGCTHALNLDGGRSSVMVINNKLVNSPSGYAWGISKNERPVSNSIMIIANPV